MIDPLTLVFGSLVLVAWVLFCACLCKVMTRRGPDPIPIRESRPDHDPDWDVALSSLRELGIEARCSGSSAKKKQFLASSSWICPFPGSKANRDILKIPTTPAFSKTDPVMHEVNPFGLNVPKKNVSWRGEA